MYRKELPDGTVVEITGADAYSGPGNCFALQHVNTNVVWYRCGTEQWRRSNERSIHQTRMALELCETKDDVHELLDFNRKSYDDEE